MRSGRRGLQVFVLALALSAAGCGLSAYDHLGTAARDAGEDVLPDAGEPATCTNGSKDGDESDRDCGGSCAPCVNGLLCGLAADCASGRCESGTCARPADCVRADGTCAGRCGEVADDCGDALDCGGCAEPATCGGGGVRNRCGCSESDVSFCRRLAKTCGVVEAPDACGRERRVDCGACPAGESCRADHTCTCTPESDAALCARLGRECGGVTGAIDDCGVARTIASCGTCGGGETCGASGVCGCTPEGKDAFCGRGGAKCGRYTAADACGASRTEDCGACAFGTCGATNTCECTPETNLAFCTRTGVECGRATGADNCGVQRTVTECGPCAVGTCSAGRCGCTGESDAAMCARLGKNCGSLTAPDNCGRSRTVNCGACVGTCSNNVCSCSGETVAELCAAEPGVCGAITRTDRCGASRTVTCGCAKGACVAGRCGCGENDWVVETVDATGEVGVFNSLAVRDGVVHVAYSDETTSQRSLLRYARRAGGAWNREVVPLGPYAELGDSAMLGLDTTGRPRIVTVVGRRELVEFERTVVGNWAPSSVRHGDDYYARAYRIDASGQRHLAFIAQDADGSHVVLGRTLTGQWSFWTIDHHANDLDLAVDASGGRHLVAMTGNYGAEDVTYAKPSGSTFTEQLVESGDGASIAVDPAGSVHVFYAGHPSPASCLTCSVPIRHAVKTTSGTTWTKSTVTTSPSPTVGRRTRIAIDPSGTIHALYYESVSRKIRYARRASGAGTWQLGTVDTVSSGEQISLAIDADRGVHVTYYDQFAADLRYAYKCPAP